VARSGRWRLSPIRRMSVLKFSFDFWLNSIGRPGSTGKWSLTRLTAALRCTPCALAFQASPRLSSGRPAQSGVAIRPGETALTRTDASSSAKPHLSGYRALSWRRPPPTPEPFFDTSRISDQRAPTSSRPRPRPTSATALLYYRVRHNKHCCSAIAGLPPRGPSFACGGVQRQPLLAQQMQQLAEQQAR
jgi:hypothetical protein